MLYVIAIKEKICIYRKQIRLSLDITLRISLLLFKTVICYNCNSFTISNIEGIFAHIFRKH